MNYYSDGTYHSSLKEPTMHSDNYISPLLLPISNKNRLYFHTFRPFLIIIDPAKEKIRLFDAATKKVNIKVRMFKCEY